MRTALHAFLVSVLTYVAVANAYSLEGHGLEGHLSEFDNVAGVNPDPQNPAYAGIGSKRCMKDLGCFEITKDFFHPTRRPVNFLPLDRASINVKFVLYTKENPKEHDYLNVNDPEDLKNSPLDPTHRTAFIVHGFFDSRYYGKWMETLKDDLILFTDYNIIIVDWSKGNGAPYTQATANTRVVGAEIALMIEALKKYKGVKSMDCHIIGHSLGAHIAGYAGERLNKLGRISGLDPAQPYFEQMPPSVRLDPTDADFVDVIHTDSASLKLLALGMSQAVGHVDFYPNNGMNQPGCATSSIHSILLEGLIDAARRFMSCNHQRSVDFFTYSINFKKALPVAYKCEDYQTYLEGNCGECGVNNSNCAVMGLKADQFKPNKNDNKEVKMYMTTLDAKPFWEYSYQVKIKLRNIKYDDEGGQIFIRMQGAKDNYDVTLKTKNGNLIHGALYSFLIRNKESFGEIKNLTFKWKTSSWKFYKTHAISVEYVNVIPMNLGDNKLQKQQTKKFCDKLGKPIKSGSSSVLVPC